MPASEGNTALLEDIHDMERMITTYLAFARGEGEEPRMVVDVRALLAQVMARFRHHTATCVLAPGNACYASVRPEACMRVFVNILDNAFRFATKVTIVCSSTPAAVVITIGDNGPGIPATQRDAVLRPFVRYAPETTAAELLPSTDEDTHAGLGLAIARAIVQGHGGTLLLGASPEGGLLVQITLPAIPPVMGSHAVLDGMGNALVA
jgi:two-component system osmolarity sensor histidine kinase EnvZ